MPLIRFEVKNEYGLGDPELYRRACNKEDPKAILDGVAVAGLVGILRQLGDLSEFAADVFRDLHEQVMTTAARGRKMLTRIQRIEAALPPLEKAVQGQRSHIHFSYIAGSDWHATVRTEQSQLLSSDLPQFMIDSYEESRDPPRLYLLDKFDDAGAGACLKRYSDPSYFKRLLASSELVKAEKEKRKKKKRGSRLRNGEVQHAVLIPRDSSSTQFASPGTDRLSLSAENVSMSDSRSKPELASESTSFDSKTRLNYVEIVSDTPLVAPDELEYSGFSTSTPNINQSDPCASTLHNEQNGESPDDDSQHVQCAPSSSSVMWDEKTEIVKPTSPGLCNDALADRVQDSQHVQSAPSSSSIMWDEKTEIVKPTSPGLCNDALADRVQDSESLPQSSEPSNLGHEIARVGILDQEDIVFDIAKLPVSFSGVKQFNEVTSETDNYMDAPNTLESEIELGSECQTKREVKSLSNFNYGDWESASSKIQETNAPNLDYFDAQVPIASYSSSNNHVSPRLSSLVLSGGLDHVQLTHTTDFDHNSNYSVGSDSSESHFPNVSRISGCEGLNNDLSPKSSIANEQALVVDETRAKVSELQDSPAATSNVPSIRFWTNGGILGVEPSKPPDFSILNVVSDNILHHGRLTANSEPVVMFNESISRNSCFVEERDKSHDEISVKQNSQESIRGPSLGELDKNQDLSAYKTYAHIDSPDEKDNIAAAPASCLLVTPNIESRSNGPGQSPIGISAGFSGLAHRILLNGVQRRILVAHADVSTPSQLLDTDIRRSRETSLRNEREELPSVVSHAVYKLDTKEKIEVGSSEKPVPSSSPYSGSSSPPLEHMKISFHPMNLETSKLRLEFSNGNLHESTEASMFPSFMLIPGPSIPLLDSGSESDDDTFCRSCTCSFEDLLSPRSNSELWGEDERSGSLMHEASDDSRRISSSTTSICSSMEFEQMDRCSINPAPEFEILEVENGTISFQSDGTVDLPGVDSVIFSKNQQQEIRDTFSIDAIDSTSHLLNELPRPPPPPMQWKVMKPAFASVEDKDSTSAKFFDHFDGLQTQNSATHQKQKQDAPRSPCNAEHDQQKLNGHTELNHTSNSKELDKRAELLQQIRNKSFNLRRTPGPATNVKVAAILEKSDVISQAFAGSDKERDNDYGHED